MRLTRKVITLGKNRAGIGLPLEMRKALGIEYGDIIEFEIHEVHKASEKDVEKAREEHEKEKMIAMDTVPIQKRKRRYQIR